MRFPASLALACLALALAGETHADRDDGRDDERAAPSAVAPLAEASLAVEDLKIGTGPVAEAGHTLIVEYTGWLKDPKAKAGKGRKFDSSIGREPFQFVLGSGRVIRGWELGMTGMRVGGIRRLTIPPQLAYGARGAGGGIIPPFSTLIFEVELVAVGAAVAPPP